MIIEQLLDSGLAHHSYMVISEGEMAVIDPARDPKPYLDYAAKHQAKVVAIIETHPHADFVSSHAEIARKTRAKIYVSKLLGADYAHEPFDDGDTIQLGKTVLKAMNTPGHSPDSISVVLEDENGKDHALFSGDTLFIGDVGRPDLREKAGNMTAKREELARMMFRTVQDKLKKLDPEVIVYPAHGAGSLCGKNMSTDSSSTIGRELKENYAFQVEDEEEFVKILLADQPFIPKYFGFDVAVNKKGALDLEESLAAVTMLKSASEIEEGVLVIDVRPADQFKQAHYPNAINIMEGGKFETWLGSIVGPDEPYYLVAQNEEELKSVIAKTAKIGYEVNIKGALAAPEGFKKASPAFDLEAFRANPENFTIVDIRNWSEVQGGKIFDESINIPLPELRERVSEIPTDKPIVLHCAGGYRSAAGQSIVEAALEGQVAFDLSEAIKDFNPQTV